MSERKKILWLVSWYPNKYDPFDGDFIQRHAQAAALYDDINVLFVKQSEQQEREETEWAGSAGLTEQIVYLPVKRGAFHKLNNFLSWQKAYKDQVKSIVKEHHPHTIHVHVPWKAGLIANWARKKYGIPFVITEHWGIYNRFVEDNIYKRPFLTRYLLKTIFRNASGFASVSTFLGNGVNESLVRKQFIVIPNVVDTKLFTPSDNKQGRFTFLHVSNMVPLKNVEGIIQAFDEFQRLSGRDAQLVLIGRENPQAIALAKALDRFNKSIFFRGEIAYPQVASEMQRSHVFILNSRIENSPCVIGEALCCGLPVIATSVGGVPELVQKNNGILVRPGCREELVAAMTTLFNEWKNWYARLISPEAARRFSYQAVGAAFHRLYAAGENTGPGKR